MGFWLVDLRIEDNVLEREVWYLVGGCSFWYNCVGWWGRGISSGCVFIVCSRIYGGDVWWFFFCNGLRLGGERYWGVLFVWGCGVLLCNSLDRLFICFFFGFFVGVYFIWLLWWWFMCVLIVFCVFFGVGWFWIWWISFVVFFGYVLDNGLLNVWILWWLVFWLNMICVIEGCFYFIWGV